MSRAWFEYFKKHGANKCTVDSTIHKSTIDDLIFNKLTIYEFIASKSTVTELMVPEKHLLNIDNYFSHCTDEFFQFIKGDNIGLVCLSSHATHFPYLVDIRIFKTLANPYYWKPDKWQQAGNTNINRSHLISVFKYVSVKAETEKNNKTLLRQQESGR